MSTHSSVLAWRIPGIGKPGGLPSMGSHRIRHDWSDLAAATDVYWFKSWVGFSCLQISLWSVLSLQLLLLIFPLCGLCEHSPSRWVFSCMHVSELSTQKIPFKRTLYWGGNPTGTLKNLVLYRVLRNLWIGRGIFHYMIPRTGCPVKDISIMLCQEMMHIQFSPGLRLAASLIRWIPRHYLTPTMMTSLLLQFPLWLFLNFVSCLL